MVSALVPIQLPPLQLPDRNTDLSLSMKEAIDTWVAHCEEWNEWVRKRCEGHRQVAYEVSLRVHRRNLLLEVYQLRKLADELRAEADLCRREAFSFAQEDPDFWNAEIRALNQLEQNLLTEAARLDEQILTCNTMVLILSGALNFESPTARRRD